jgi:hypothetical protein
MYIFINFTKISSVIHVNRDITPKFVSTFVVKERTTLEAISTFFYAEGSLISLLCHPAKVRPANIASFLFPKLCLETPDPEALPPLSL